MQKQNPKDLMHFIGKEGNLPFQIYSSLLSKNYIWDTVHCLFLQLPSRMIEEYILITRNAQRNTYLPQEPLRSFVSEYYKQLHWDLAWLTCPTYVYQHYTCPVYRHGLNKTWLGKNGKNYLTQLYWKSFKE